MKTFAATLLAASAAATTVELLPLTAIPDYIAGFMYGMTGDNNLTEIEACWQGGELVESDIKTFLDDLEHFKLFAAVEEIGTIFGDAFDGFKDCVGMEDDVAAIFDWSLQFLHPKELAETMAKNYVLHSRKATADVEAVKADWSAANYFGAGVDTADLATLLVGPITPDYADYSLENVSLNVKGAAEFVAGFIFGFTGDNHLIEIQSCFQGGQLVEQDVLDAVADFKDGKWFAGFNAIGLVVDDAKADLALCKSTQDDIAAIEEWAQIFKQPEQLAAEVAKNFVMHERKVKADISAMEADWTAESYFNSGIDAADALTLLLGPVE